MRPSSIPAPKQRRTTGRRATRPRPESERLAITGAFSFLGGQILRRILQDRDEDDVVTIDLAPAAGRVRSVRHRNVDLTDPASDQQLLDVFREEGVATVLHLAFFTDPQRDAAIAHEVESIGTLNLFAAAAAAGVRHVVMRSFTAVYGARGRNPNFLTESQPLPQRAALPWLRDKVEAEQHADSFAKRFPELAVTVLRFAPLLGPGVRNFYTGLLDRRLLPVPMGYDPLVQLLHPEDAVDAVLAALRRAPRAPVNVVPKDVIPLRTMLHLAGKIPVPIPHPLAYAAAELLWASGLGPAPSGFVDFARYLCVADGEKARRELGFEARYRSREALDSYIRYRHPRSRGQSDESEDVLAEMEVET